VAERVQYRGPDALDQRSEARFAAEIAAHHQRVGEETDYLLELAPWPIDDGSSDRDVDLAAVAVKQPGQRRQQHHVGRGLHLGGECAHRRGKVL
jgi:hypothetical protein